MDSPADFLKIANVTQLIGMVGSFMESKFGIRVNERISESALMGLFIEAMQKISAARASDDTLTTLNFRAMSTIKDQLKGIFRIDGGGPVPGPGPVPIPVLVQQQGPFNILESQDTLNDQRTITSMAAAQQVRDESQSAMKQDDFFKRIKELDDQRRHAQEAAAAGFAPLAPPMPQQQQQKAMPASIATSVPLPTPSYQMKSKQVVINSADRKWTFSPPRNVFVWSGPLPRGTFEMVCAFLPARAAATAPYINLEIQGAGGQNDTFVLISDIPSPPQGRWQKYIPVAEAAIPLSCPWTIKLKGHDHAGLPLGDDGYLITQSSERSATVGGGAHVQVSGNITDFTVGDILSIMVEGVAAALSATIVGVGRTGRPDTCFLDLNTLELPAIGGRIMNMSHQVSLIFRFI